MLSLRRLSLLYLLLLLLLSSSSSSSSSKAVLEAESATEGDTQLVPVDKPKAKLDRPLATVASPDAIPSLVVSFVVHCWLLLVAPLLRRRSHLVLSLLISWISFLYLVLKMSCQQTWIRSP